MKKAWLLVTLLILTGLAMGQTLTNTCAIGTVPGADNRWHDTGLSCTNNQSIPIGGGSLTIYNQLHGVNSSFEYLLSGGLTTVSISLQGCMRGGTCTTLETYTTVANTIRTISSSVVYDYYTITPTGTGGSSPVLTVNTSISMASLPPAAMLGAVLPGVTSNGSGINVAGTIVLAAMVADGGKPATNDPNFVGMNGTFTRRYTSPDVGAGLQLVQPIWLNVDAYGGGINNISTTKTQWSGLRTSFMARSVGVRTGSLTDQRCTGTGDCIGADYQIHDWGGYGTGGDEGAHGLRSQVSQGIDDSTNIPNGTVASVSGNTVTGTWAVGGAGATNAWLGEGRPLINTSRNSYSIGTLASATLVSPTCTITGSGTAWSALTTGAHSDLFMELTAQSVSPARFVVPITSITNDTTLVVSFLQNSFGAQCPVVSNGDAYHIFHGGMVTALSAVMDGSSNPTGATLAIIPSAFQAGDTIEQPYGANWTPHGLWVAMQRTLPGHGIGAFIYNTGTQQMDAGAEIFGPWKYAVYTDGNSPTFLYSSGVSSLFQDTGTAGATLGIASVLNSSAQSRTFNYDRTHDMWAFGAGGFNVNAATGAIAQGTNVPPAATTYYMGWQGAGTNGLLLNAPTGTTSGILNAQVGGTDQFAVSRYGTYNSVIFNAASRLFGFSGNYSGQTWTINSATGAAAFVTSSANYTIPAILYSAAGTAVPTCNSGTKGAQATVSDATTPTYMGAYTSGGGITAAVICSYNGTTYAWLTH